MGHLHDNLLNLISPESLSSFANAVQLKVAPLQNSWGFNVGSLRLACRRQQYQKVIYI